MYFGASCAKEKKQTKMKAEVSSSFFMNVFGGSSQQYKNILHSFLKTIAALLLLLYQSIFFRPVCYNLGYHV